jgi:hypothetical protein
MYVNGDHLTIVTWVAELDVQATHRFYSLATALPTAAHLGTQGGNPITKQVHLKNIFTMLITQYE